MNEERHRAVAIGSMSSREESLTAEIDDLTLIAEFDCPSDEEQTSYYITSTYEIVGLSLTEDAKNASGLHFENGSHEPMRNHMHEDDLWDAGKRHFKSFGIQATITQCSRATSPSTLEVTNKDGTFNENITTLKVMPLVSENIMCDLVEELDEQYLSQHKRFIEDKCTMTDKIMETFEMTDNNLMTGTDAGVMLPRKLVTRDVATHTDLIEENAVSKIMDPQDFTSTSNMGVQVALAVEPEPSQVADLGRLLKENEHWKNFLQKLEADNEEMLGLIKILESKVENPQTLKNLQKEKKNLELILLELRNKMQNMLEDSVEDVKFLELKLNQTLREMDAKNAQLNEMSLELEKYRGNETNFEKTIQNLKAHLRNSNNQFTGDSKEFLIRHDKKNLKSSNMESDDDATLPFNMTMDNNYESLLTMYNQLRRIASRVQAAISPLKAKLSIANRKCRRKDDLLKRLMEKSGENMPLELAYEIEDNIKDDDPYRPLSPLTVTLINRLEHSLINHLYEKVPYFIPNSDGSPIKRSFTSDDLVKIERNSPEEILYGLAKNASPLFDGSKCSNSSKLQNLSYSSCYYEKKIFDESTVGVPPPQNFRIEDVLDMENFLFCWEPTNLSSIVGYELYVNGLRKDFIPGLQSSKYILSFYPIRVFPTVFELLSVKSDGASSVPSKIVVHGLQKLGHRVHGMKGLKKLYHDNEPSSSSLVIGDNNDMFVACYDYTSSGFSFNRNGASFSELSFKTGDIIETFGETLPNGYVIGKIRGNSVSGLIPATFLEKIFIS